MVVAEYLEGHTNAAYTMVVAEYLEGHTNTAYTSVPQGITEDPQTKIV
jgi:hypothetical protein